jgi:hypothetical protein
VDFRQLDVNLLVFLVKGFVLADLVETVFQRPKVQVVLNVCVRSVPTAVASVLSSVSVRVRGKAVSM